MDEQKLSKSLFDSLSVVKLLLINNIITTINYYILSLIIINYYIFVLLYLYYICILFFSWRSLICCERVMKILIKIKANLEIYMEAARYLFRDNSCIWIINYSLLNDAYICKFIFLWTRLKNFVDPLSRNLYYSWKL